MKRPDILVSFGGATEQFDRAVAKVKGTTASLGKSLSAAASKFGGLFGIGGAIGVAGLASELRETTKWADELANAADRVGQSVENIQTIRLEAEKLGLSTQATDTALQRFARRVAEAKLGMGVLAKEFERYNIQLRDSAGNYKSNSALLEEFAAALQGIDDKGEIARVSMAAFDTEGVKLGQTFAQMGGSIDDLTKDFLALGRVLGEDTVRQAAALETAWTEMTQGMESSFKSFLLSVVSGWQQIRSAVKHGVDYVENSLSIVKGLSEVNAEILTLERAIKEIANAPTPTFGSETDHANRRARQLTNLTLEYGKLLQKRKAIIGQTVAERKAERVAAQETGAVVVEGAKKKSAAVKTSNKERVESAKATADAEIKYWQSAQNLINALQDKNVKAAEYAKSRIKQAIAEMTAAGVPDYMVNYYEKRELISDADRIPSIKFNPVVDPEGYKAMSEQMKKSLKAENFTITVKPILDVGQVNTLQEESDQTGHDES